MQQRDVFPLNGFRFETPYCVHTGVVEVDDTNRTPTLTQVEVLRSELPRPQHVGDVVSSRALRRLSEKHLGGLPWPEQREQPIHYAVVGRAFDEDGGQRHKTAGDHQRASAGVP